MKADKETVKKIAHLARLEFEGAKADEMVKGMNEMLDFVEKLKELNTDGVEPLTHISTELNVMRDDLVKNTITHEEALRNAPKKDSDYIRVPKVIE